MPRKSKCKGCDYASNGTPNPCSDICQDCKNVPNTGWGGYTDNSKIDKSNYVNVEKHTTGTVKVPDIRLVFGDAAVVFNGVEEMTESDLCSKLWQLSMDIEKYMKEFPCVITNKSGKIIAIAIQ